MSLTFQDVIRAGGQRLSSGNQSSVRRRTVKPDAVRQAVEEWQSTLPGRAQETIAKLITDEWFRRGGKGLQLGDIERNNRQNIFRWLDNPNRTEKYAGYVLQLAPVIADVMPIEIARKYELKQGKTKLELVADAIKECADAKQAALLGAPLRELEKEIREGIESLVRLAPPDRWAAVMASAAAMFSGCM
ncbi:toxin YdaT family protein [Serratia nevei]|uniref:toxin YdaT family protein n=1 Tax=Serratia TaxID=613 RepID=UPI00066D80F7|nr:toxin YdaT family protein [Serratia marcescens]